MSPHDEEHDGGDSRELQPNAAFTCTSLGNIIGRRKWQRLVDWMTQASIFTRTSRTTETQLCLYAVCSFDKRRFFRGSFTDVWMPPRRHAWWCTWQKQTQVDNDISSCHDQLSRPPNAAQRRSAAVRWRAAAFQAVAITPRPEQSHQHGPSIPGHRVSLGSPWSLTSPQR